LGVQVYAAYHLPMKAMADSKGGREMATGIQIPKAGDIIRHRTYRGDGYGPYYCVVKVYRAMNGGTDRIENYVEAVQCRKDGNPDRRQPYGTDTRHFTFKDASAFDKMFTISPQVRVD